MWFSFLQGTEKTEVLSTLQLVVSIRQITANKVQGEVMCLIALLKHLIASVGLYSIFFQPYQLRRP